MSTTETCFCGAIQLAFVSHVFIESKKSTLRYQGNWLTLYHLQSIEGDNLINTVSLPPCSAFECSYKTVRLQLHRLPQAYRIDVCIKFHHSRRLSEICPGPRKNQDVRDDQNDCDGEHHDELLLQ